MMTTDLRRGMRDAVLGESTRYLGQSLGLHPDAHRDIIRRYADDFTFDGRGELVARSGEKTEVAIRDKLMLLRADPTAAHYFMGEPATPSTSLSKTSQPFHKLSAREKLALANGHDPLEYL